MGSWCRFRGAPWSRNSEDAQQADTIQRFRGILQRLWSAELGWFIRPSWHANMISAFGPRVLRSGEWDMAMLEKMRRSPHVPGSIQR